MSGKKHSIEVKIIRCKNLKPKGGFHDDASPYCILTCAGQKKKTSTVKKTNDPIFNEPFTLKTTDLRETIIQIEVWDHQGSGFKGENSLGQLSLSLKNIKLDTQGNWFILHPWIDKNDKRKSKKKELQNTNIDVGQIQIAFSLPMEGIKEINLNQKSKIETLLKQHKTLEKSANTPLEIEGFQLTQIPPIIFQEVPHIEILSFSFNRFAELPNDISLFENLRVLKFIGNKLTNILPSIGKLTTLEELWLNGNELTTFEKSISLLPKLLILSLSNNLISELPSEIGYMVKLEEFYLNGNPLKDVNPYMGLLTHLEVLDLSCCQISSIPDEFTNLKKLLELNLSENNLTELPKYMGRMTRLSWLNLAGNKLTDLPISMGYCTGLGRIGSGYNLSNNPWKNKDLVKKFAIGTDQIVDYLIKRMNKQKEEIIIPDLKLSHLTQISTLSNKLPNSNSTTNVREIYQNSKNEKNEENNLHLNRAFTVDRNPSSSLWVQYTTASGVPYWFNRKRRESTYVKPTELLATWDDEEDKKDKKNTDENIIDFMNNSNSSSFFTREISSPIVSPLPPKSQKNQINNNNSNNNSNSNSNNSTLNSSLQISQTTLKQVEDNLMKNFGATKKQNKYNTNKEVENNNNNNENNNKFNNNENNNKNNNNENNNKFNNNENNNENNNKNNNNNNNENNNKNKKIENDNKVNNNSNQSEQNSSNTTTEESDISPKKGRNRTSTIDLTTNMNKEQLLLLEKKLSALSSWCRTTIDEKIIPILKRLIQLSEQSTDLSTIFKYGQKTTSIKTDTEKLKALVLGCGISLPTSRTPSKEEDKLNQIKVTIVNALLQTIALMYSVKKALDNASTNQIVAFVTSIKAICEKLEKV